MQGVIRVAANALSRSIKRMWPVRLTPTALAIVVLFAAAAIVAGRFGAL
jgi:hypothetical protein